MTTPPGEPDAPSLGPAVGLFLLSGTVQYVGAAIAVGLFAVMSDFTVAWWRIALAAVLLLAWRRPWRHRLTRRQLAGSALFGVVLASMNLLFYAAISRIPLGTAVSLEFLGPVAVAAAGARGLRPRLVVALALLGVLLIGGLGLDLADPTQLVGALFALAAGVAWAGYILLGRRIAAARDGIDSLAIGMTAGALVFGPFLAPGLGDALGAPLTFVMVLGVAVFSSLLPYSIEQLVLRRVSADVFALLTSLLPATSLLVGLVVLGQVPSAGEVGGLLAISAAIALTAVVPRARPAGSRRSRRRAPEPRK